MISRLFLFSVAQVEVVGYHADVFRCILYIVPFACYSVGEVPETIRPPTSAFQ